MREVELRLRMDLAKAMSELRIWLDHNNCVPLSFDISKKSRGVLVRLVFADDHVADVFKREFGR